MLENGFYAVNMLSVLDPDIRERRARRAYENPDSWMIVFDDQSRMTFDRTTGNLTRYDMPMMHNLAFSTYLFGNHVRIAGYAMPQNIQILSNDRRTAVTIQVQSYEVNAAISELTLDIPAHIRIIRQ
jgi:outer membrane lipoprotein-sorting protein